MAPRWRTAWDLLAAIAAAIGLIMISVYVYLIRQQGGEIAVWFLAGLAVVVALCGYGAARAAPRRVWALAVSGVVMVMLGAVGILSIGCPILCAGVLALVAALRALGSARRASR